MSNGLLCRWDGSDYRCQTASASTYGLAGDVMISGNQEADLTALGGGDATVNSADGDVNVFSGGALTVGVQAQTGIQAGSNGTLSINGTTATGDVQVVSVGNLSGILTATTGSVTALSVAGENATVSAGNDATVFGGTGLGGGVNAGHNVQAVSYGNISALPGISEGNDLWVFGVGNVTGAYSAGDAVEFFGSDSSIQANITAEGSGNGTVCVVTAWGNIGGSITSASSIAGVNAGGTVGASLSAPTVGTITQNDTGLIGTRPVLGDVGQAGLAAAVKGLVAQGQ